MLIGQYQHNIDAKGRVIVPSKFREALGEKFIVTRGLDHCLFVYAQSRWLELVAKIETLPWTSADVRRFSRFFMAGASECEIDNQGRILIPQTLREYAHLEKQIVSIGVGDRVEIWNRETWESYNQEETDAENELAERMAEFHM